MKTSYVSILAILATMLFAVACGESQSETTAESTETPSAQTPPEGEATAEEPAAPAQAAAGGEAAGGEAQAGEAAGGSVCERAVTCCEAYVSAMGSTVPGLSTETACAGVRQAGSAPGGDAACTAAIGGWRTGLQGMQQAVPAACAE